MVLPLTHGARSPVSMVSTIFMPDVIDRSQRVITVNVSASLSSAARSSPSTPDTVPDGPRALRAAHDGMGQTRTTMRAEHDQGTKISDHHVRSPL